MDIRVLDIEVYPDFYCFVFRWKDKLEYYENFRNEKINFKPVDLVKKLGEHYLFTMNGDAYDLQICEHFRRGNFRVEALYELSSFLINSHRIHYPKSDYFIKQHTDIMSLQGYNSRLRAASLKFLEFSMRYYRMASLPYDPTKPLKDYDKAVKVREYCYVDCGATEHAAIIFKDKIESRWETSREWGENVNSLSDNHLGVERILREISRYSGIPIEKLRRMRSTYEKIEVADVIFKDRYRFNIPELKGALERFQNTTVFPEKDGTFDFRDKGRFSVHIDQSDFTFGFGFGGIHGATVPGDYTFAKDVTCNTDDVESMYPITAIRNKLAMSHFPREPFTLAYNGMFIDRKKYPKGTPQNIDRKLGLNAASGNANNPYSPLYDPKYFLTITINCQLSIVMLADLALTHIPGARLMMINTDGLEVTIPKKYQDKYNKIKAWWMKHNGYNLEGKTYDRMFIKNVNNYVSISSEGKAKRKGGDFLTYEDYVQPQDYHRNPSWMVIGNAIFQHISGKSTIENHVRNETNVHEFLYGLKVSSRFKTGRLSSHKIEAADFLYNSDWSPESVAHFKKIYESSKDDIQHRSDNEKVLRFYATNKGGEYIFRNWKDGNFIAVVKNVRMKIQQDIPEHKGSYTRIMNEIDRDFYIEQAKSRIEGVSPVVIGSNG